MKNIVLISHGGLAEGVKSSLEMIAGKQENVYTVTLTPDGDNLQFARDLDEKMKTLSGKTIIIADLLGGTPANVALKHYVDDANVDIMSGLSLPLALESVLNSERTPTELLSAAKATMADLKLAAEHENESDAVPPAVQGDMEAYADYAGKANIVNTRIDERLIHGQVAGIWSTSLDAERIIVANDEAAADPLQKSSLRMAAPKAMRLSVLPVEEAAKNINAGKYGAQRIFLLFKNPEDVGRFITFGGTLKTLNVGNMSHKEGARGVTKNIYVTPAEEKVFMDLADRGMTITAQLVPNHPAIDFIKKLKGKE